METGGEKMTKLGKYFTLEELIVTNTGLPNKPTSIEIERLKVLVEKVLDPLRQMYGHPIKVNSGYRSFAVNKKVKGSTTSQHCKGEAADITGYDNKKLFDLLKNNFDFDQLIDEKNLHWVHVSYTNRYKNRKQILKL